MRWLLISICLGLFTTSAFAWGHKGHAAVAALAQANLTPAALAQVRELLADDLDRYEKPSHRKTLASIASWADEIRDIAPPDMYRGWHIRANQVCSDKLGACKDGNCVDQLIIRYTAILKDRSQPLRARNEALKWVMHLVGDLHQPLHSGINIDKGNIPAGIVGVATRPGTTFHSLWDTDIAELALRSGPLQGRLSDNTPLPADAPTEWMKESRDVARKSAYEALPGFTCNAHLPKPLMVDDVYMQQAAVVARRQMENAGLRLANVLNDALAEKH
ncbi:S1/P1 nuclease [Uliginosibacterium sp. H3]|uniref:S1/P1 nuclease n=1 Tax=Uliginosibacterium silvisoli TaxID=3114758 RepID=A0ABU6K251_9RHOO|nr:S1/P1 nuclease [Uliginosibacterium sp. H3]